MTVNISCDTVNTVVRIRSTNSLLHSKSLVVVLEFNDVNTSITMP